MEHEYTQYIEPTSMLYWWPRARFLDIPQPRTLVLEFDHQVLQSFAEAGVARHKVLNGIQDSVRHAIELNGFTYPVFLRTDLSSGKHEYQRSCFLKDPELLHQNLVYLIEQNELAGIMGLNYRAIVVREYIELEAPFQAFRGKLPIAKERRYFVRDGVVEEHFPYWPKEAIWRPSVKDWEFALEAINHETESEIEILTKYAELVGNALPGYWSVDFAKSRQGVWYLIDMAEGDKSWRPEEG